MLEKVLAWQRQRQRQKDKDEKKQRPRRSPLYNVGPSDNLDRSWVEAGTPSPSASRTASRISPEISSFMSGTRIFGKSWDFVSTWEGGGSFAIPTFGQHFPNQLLTSTFQFFLRCSPLQWWRRPPASPQCIQSGRSQLARQLKRHYSYQDEKSHKPSESCNQVWSFKTDV